MFLKGINIVYDLGKCLTVFTPLNNLINDFGAFLNQYKQFPSTLFYSL